MKIVESHIQGKYPDQSKCEDGLYISNDLVAVIDGATSNSSFLISNHKSGWYAKELIIQALTSLPRSLHASQAVEYVADYYNAHLADIHFPTSYAIPRAVVAAYNEVTHEVWTYGDCQVQIDGERLGDDRHADELTSRLRSFLINYLLRDGSTEQSLLENDSARREILPFIEKQLIFENSSSSEWGYPVFNGSDIDPGMLSAAIVNTGATVVMATDGYPCLRSNLEESEKELQRLLVTDPLCYKKHKSTKGIQPGAGSFDDRAFIKILVE